MEEFVIDLNKYVIGVDLGLFEGDIRSLCVAHQENDIIVIDENFASKDSKESR